MGSSETKVEKLLRLAKKGLIRARDLEENNIPRIYLRRLCDRGELERVDRGVYRLLKNPVTQNHSIAHVAKRVPQATICLLSALQFHELTMELPHAVWIMIDRNARMPKFNYPKIEVVRASGSARTHGVEIRIIEGVDVRITTPSKTVADCFRFRSHVGQDVAIEALRDYLARSREKKKPTSDPNIFSINKLIEAARAVRIYTVLRPFLEAMV